MGFFPYTHAVFGMMADKDIDGVLAAIGERVDHWYVVDQAISRAASAGELSERLAARGIPSGEDQSVTCCASPSAGLDLARERAGENDRILVFGSFHVLADILPSPMA